MSGGPRPEWWKRSVNGVASPLTSDPNAALDSLSREGTEPGDVGAPARAVTTMQAGAQPSVREVPPSPPPTKPRRAPASTKPRPISPFYESYLDAQQKSIRGAVLARGGTDDEADADVIQFLDMERKTPFSVRPSLTLGDAEPAHTPAMLQGVSMALVQGATFGFGDEAVGSILGLLTGDHPVRGMAALGGAGAVLAQGAMSGNLKGASQVAAKLVGSVPGGSASSGIRDYQAEYAKFGAAHRPAQIAGEVVGGIAGAMLGSAELGAGAAVAGAARPTAGAVIGRGLVGGAKYGAVAGFGNSDAPLDWSLDMLHQRTRDALFGAGAGAVVGGGLSTAGQIAKPLASVAGRAIADSPLAQRIAARLGAIAAAPPPGTPTTPGAAIARRIARVLTERVPDGRAIETALNDMERAGITPEQARLDAAGLSHMGLRPTFLDVMSERFQRMMGGVFAERTTPAIEAVQSLEARQMRVPEQLFQQLVLRSLRNPQVGLGNIFEAENELHALGLAQAEPFYNAAHEQVVRLTPRMRQILARPEIIAAWNEAADIANGRLDARVGHGLRVPRLTADDFVPPAGPAPVPLVPGFAPTSLAGPAAPPVVLDELPIRGIDYLQRTIRNETKALFAAGKLTRTIHDERLVVLDAFERELLAESGTQVPAFRQALALYRGPMAARDAVQRGYLRFGGTNPEAGNAVQATHEWTSIRHDMERYADPADQHLRDFYRLGAAKALNERMATSTEPLDFASRYFGAGQLRYDASGAQTGVLNVDARRVLELFPDNPVAGQDFLRLLAGQARLAETFGSAVRLPKQVSPEKLEQAAVGPVPQARGTPGTTLFSALRQMVVGARAQHSEAEKRSLATLSVRGLNRPRDLDVLFDELAYRALQRGLRRGPSLPQRAARSVAAQAGRAAAVIR